MLISIDQYPKSLEFLEFSRDQVSSVPTGDPTFDKLRTVIYNNMAIYCLR